MADDIIQVKYDDAEVTRLFGQITARAQNPRPLLADWGERIKNSVRRNIREGGRPAKFAPLKPVTARNWLFSKKSYWTKAGGLTAAGRERAANRTPLFTGNPGGLMPSINWRMVPEGLAVGSDKIYAAIHNFGGQTRRHVILPKGSSYTKWGVLNIPGIGFRRYAIHPGSNIPARPYLVIQDEDWAYMRQSALGFLLGEGAWK